MAVGFEKNSGLIVLLLEAACQLIKIAASKASWHAKTTSLLAAFPFQEREGTALAVAVTGTSTA